MQYLRQWRASEGNTIETFFEAAPELGEMSQYDLSEYEGSE